MSERLRGIHADVGKKNTTSEDRPSASEGPEQPDVSEHHDGPLVFAHPQWMMGVVLIFAVFFLVAGLNNPVWLLIGSPFILTLAVYVWVRLKGASRG